MATKKTKKVTYSEPTNYFPKSVLKEFGLGEYAEKKPAKKTTKKTTKKSTAKGKK